MSTKVGAKDQVVIDKAIRDQLGIAPGWRAYQTLDEDGVRITFRPPGDRSLMGVLKPLIKPEVLERVSGMSWREIREEAWATMAEDRVSRMNDDDSALSQ